MVRRFWTLMAFIAGLCHLTEWCSNGSLQQIGDVLLEQQFCVIQFHSRHHLQVIT